MRLGLCQWNSHRVIKNFNHICVWFAYDLVLRLYNRRNESLTGFVEHQRTKQSKFS